MNVLLIYCVISPLYHQAKEMDEGGAVYVYYAKSG